jgi:activator of HSP90 ATPase
MKIIQVEINNESAFALLKELEELKVLRIVKENVLEKKAKISEKYRNVFSKEDAKDFDIHSQTMRSNLYKSK